MSLELGFEMNKERASISIATRKFPTIKQRLVLSGNRAVVDKGSISTRLTNATLTIISDGSVRRVKRLGSSSAPTAMSSVAKLIDRAHARGAKTADFFTDFAHQAIDTGADVFVGHGSHFPMGVEIYQGKPIFYSVGIFVFQNETVGFFPRTPMSASIWA